MNPSFEPVYNFFLQGGFFMVPLLLCSLVSVGVMIWRGIALRRQVVMPKVIEQEIERLRPVEDPRAPARLSALVERDDSSLARIVRTGLRHLGWPKNETVEAVQTKARHEIVRLERGLFVLEVVVGIGPLLGLLGAVSGLVTVFAAFGQAGAVGGDPREIARGISEALSTTIVGIAVAIPSLIAYSYFSKKVEIMSAEMESLVADLLAKCYHRQGRYEQRMAEGER